MDTYNDDYYEEQASQEEIYLEETEEDLRLILECDDLYPNSGPPQPESINEQQAIEPRITGNCDDPPLSQQIVEAMLRSI